MREADVYICTKDALRARGWVIVAGQPPGGTDHLPVVEIKDPLNLLKGSGGAFKPDLVAWYRPWLLIGECKLAPDASDVRKLRAVLADPARKVAFAAELRGRSILDEDFAMYGFIAHATRAVIALADLGTIICPGDGPSIHLPASEWPAQLEIRFR